MFKEFAIFVLGYMQKFWQHISFRSSELEFKWTLFSCIIIFSVLLAAMGVPNLSNFMLLVYIAYKYTTKE